MATVSATSRNGISDAILDELERLLYAEPDNIAFQYLQTANENLREYGNENDYNVAPVIESGQVTETQRSGDRVSVTIEWDHPAARLFEFGTSRHTVRGDPLAFVWEDPPRWVRQEFDQARDERGRFASGWLVFMDKVEVSGLPAARYQRDAMALLRLLFEGRIER